MCAKRAVARGIRYAEAIHGSRSRVSTTMFRAVISCTTVGTTLKSLSMVYGPTTTQLSGCALSSDAWLLYDFTSPLQILSSHACGQVRISSHAGSYYNILISLYRLLSPLPTFVVLWLGTPGPYSSRQEEERHYNGPCGDVVIHEHEQKNFVILRATRSVKRAIVSVSHSV